MKSKSLVLRRRLAYVEAHLETESISSRHSPRLKEERRRRLTEEKIAIQKSLDSIIYPILTIPFEITAEVFVHCLPDYPTHPNAAVAPMLLARICRQWRNIACGTPRLWAALQITRWNGPDLALLARLWFGRAGGAPKSLCLWLPFDRYNRPKSFFETIGDCCPLSLPFTEHWAHLTSLHGVSFTAVECLALLACAPQLVHCVFDSLKGSPLSTPASRLVLANLDHISLASHNSTSLLLLLNSITCRALRCLHINSSFQDFPHALLPSFFQRAPDIRVFAIKFYHSPAALLTTVLNAAPALTSLRLIAHNTATFHLLDLLSQSPSFLPRIDNLALSPFFRVDWTDSEAETLINALTSRWETKSAAQLLDFEFSNLRLDSRALPSSISACVTELKGKGMRIHIGCPQTAF